MLYNAKPTVTPRTTRTSSARPLRHIVDHLGLGHHWVLIKKVVDEVGYSDDAIRAKIRRGEWEEGVIWRKGPDNRIVLDLVAIQTWMGGGHA